MSVALVATDPPKVPTEEQRRELKNSLTSEVVKYCLLDAAFKIVISATVFCFLANPANFVGFALATCLAITVSVICRSLRAYLEYEERLQGAPSPEQHIAIRATEQADAAVFGQLYDQTAGIVIHEAGHALAADLLYQNSHPHITVFPFVEGGAVTTWGPSTLSTLGNSVGSTASRMLVSGAGSLFAVLSSTAFLVAAFWMKDSHPTLSRTLMWFALASLLHHILYALSAFSDASPPGHDFAAMWALGLHPLVAVLIIVAVPAVALLICYGIKAALSQYDRVEAPAQPLPTQTPAAHSALLVPA